MGCEDYIWHNSSRYKNHLNKMRRQCSFEQLAFIRRHELKLEYRVLQFNFGNLTLVIKREGASDIHLCHLIYIIILR